MRRLRVVFFLADPDGGTTQSGNVLIVCPMEEGYAKVPAELLETLVGKGKYERAPLRIMPGKLNQWT